MKLRYLLMPCLLVLSTISPAAVLAQANEQTQSTPKPKPPACSLVVKKVHKQICSSGRQQWTVCTLGGATVSQQAGSCVGG